MKSISQRALSLARNGRYAASLGLLAPDLARRLAPGLGRFYDFSGDQDLISDNPRHPNLTPQEWKRLRRKLRLLPESPEKNCLLAFAGLCARRYAQTSHILRRLRRRYPSRPDLALLEAACLWLLGDKERSRRHLPQALAAAQQAAAQRPCREVLLLRAQILFEFEDKKGGLRDLERILRADPKDVSARLGKVEGLADSFLYGPALKEIGKLLSLRPKSWWRLAQRGRVRGMCGRLRQALDDFDEAIRRRPGHGALYAWRAEVRRKLGRLQQARQDLEAAVRLAPRYAFGWELSGRLKLLAGEPRQALKDLQKACHLDRGRLLCFAWRGEAQFKLGRLRRAWADFERIFPLHPMSTWNPPESTAGSPTPSRHRQEALWREIDELVRKRSTESAAWLLRGGLKSAAGLESEGLRDLTKALALCPFQSNRLRAAALGWRGRAIYKLGAYARACANLAQAVKLQPRRPLWRAWYGLSLLKAGKHTEGLKEMGTALARPQPCLAESFFERGSWLALRGKPEEARKDFQMAYIMNPPFPRARKAEEALPRRQGAS